MLKKIILLIIAITSLSACQSSKNKYLILYVDPMIGAGGHDHTYPGAMFPFGMAQVSPDTRWENWDGSSGYHYSDKTIMGFSQTHLSGTGATVFCKFLLMPTTGKPTVITGDEKDSKTGYRSSFDHKNEFELDKLKPLETGIISKITAVERKQEDYFGYHFSRYLKIPKDGIYKISISSNDGNTFFLDGKNLPEVP